MEKMLVEINGYKIYKSLMRLFQVCVVTRPMNSCPNNCMDFPALVRRLAEKVFFIRKTKRFMTLNE